MAKYTTEVRYICETYAGLEESVGYESIDEVIDNSYLKIFNNDKIPMYKNETEAHRAGLLKKILLHYYTREIGYETVGLWKLKLNQKMIEIMPYYNQLYESAELEFDPFKNVDVTRTHEGEYNDDEKVDNQRDTENHRGIHTTQETDTTDNTTKNESANETIAYTSVQESDSTEDITLRHSKTTTEGNDTRSNAVTKDGNSWVLFSDTPQGGLDGINAAASDVAGNGYLTNATRTIATPDEQSVTQTHGDIVETYNTNGDRKDTTETSTDVETRGNENNTKQIATTQAEAIHNETETQTTENATGKITDDNTKNTKGTDEYENKDIGKIGTETYQEMLIKYRETFLNIDLMVIRELEKLFMGLW